MNKQTRNVFTVSALTAAVLTAFGAAHAETPDELVVLSKPQSDVRAGLVLVDRDNAFAGQYSGLHDAGVYPNADISLLQRDDATGRWLRLNGRNLGLDNRELRFDHEVQGNWRYFVDYNQTLHHEPLVPNARLGGFGTTTQNSTALPAGAGKNLEFETQREILGVGFDKNLGGGFGVQVRFRNDQKQGDRMSGFYGGAAGKLFLAEPIDFTMQQWETTLNYVQDNLQLSGGYYGSSFHNQNSVLFGQGNGSAVIPQALPPDNGSHEAFLAGAYQFSPATRANFKASFGRTTQTDRFFTAPTLAGNTRRDLGGEVDTTIVHLGLSSRVTPKLSVNATARYEERDDNTPHAQYVTSSAARTGFNVTHSPRIFTSKLEAGYQLPMAFRVLGGVEFERRERSIPTIVSVRYRHLTEELASRLELKRNLSETLGGSIAYIHAERTGSSLVTTTSPTIGDLIDPIHWGDRERDKWRLALDWTPLDMLSVQVVAEDARDRYPSGPLGRDSGKNQLFALDATYVFSDAWQASAWFSQDDVRATQLQFGAAATSATTTGPNQTWTANLRTLGDALGIGVQGKLIGKLQVGAELQHSRDRAEYRLQASSGSLPDITYRRTLAKLYGAYALQANSGIRLDLSHERLAASDWTWNSTPVLFGDGTTVLLEPTQKVTFVGLSGYYKWW